MNLWETAVEATKHPKVQSSLQKALKHIGEENNRTVDLDNYGGQGLIFKLYSEKYAFPLLIKIPFYTKHSSELIAEHGILKEARIMDAITRSEEDVTPKLIAFDENGLYLVREYANGEELSAVLDKSDETKRDELLVKEFELVKKLFSIFHNNQQEHYTIRDLKPKNIIHTADEKLYVIDCGSCRPEAQMISRDREKAIKRLGNGKYLHWPIEQLLEDETVCDRRVDYFAWGVMAYYTLFLERAYVNDFSNVQKAKKEYMQRYVIACERINEAYTMGRLTEQLKENIICSLHPDPNQRWFIV